MKSCFSVTKTGLQIPIENMSVLKVLQHEHKFEVIAELAEKALYLKPENLCRFPFHVLRLSEFSYRVLAKPKPYVTGSLGLVLSLCDSIVKVEIHLEKGFTNVVLSCLRTSKTLRELIINRWQEDEIKITFDDGVTSLLKVIGNSLAILDLSCFEKVNFGTIIECRGVEVFSTDENPVHSIITRDCCNITKEDVYSWRIKRHRMKWNFHWIC